MEIHNIEIPLDEADLKSTFPLFVMQCEQISENKFVFSENQYLKIAGEWKGPFSIQCLKCNNLSKNTFEFNRHLLTIHNIQAPPYECFAENIKKENSNLNSSDSGKLPDICDYKSEKSHFNSFLIHFNENHVKYNHTYEFKRHLLEIHNIEFPLNEAYLKSPLSATEFEKVYESMTGRKICKEPVGCFIQVNEFKNENEECNNNNVKSEINMENKIKKEIKMENIIESKNEVVSEHYFADKSETEIPTNWKEQKKKQLEEEKN